jgi:hypothetical protein
MEKDLEFHPFKSIDLSQVCFSVMHTEVFHTRSVSIESASLYTSILAVSIGLRSQSSL